MSLINKIELHLWRPDTTWNHFLMTSSPFSTVYRMVSHLTGLDCLRCQSPGHMTTVYSPGGQTESQQYHSHAQYTSHNQCIQVIQCNISWLWRHNGRDSVSNHQPHDCLLNRLFRRRSKKTSKLRVTGLCAGNSPGRSEFPAQMASNAEKVSIWWLHHILFIHCGLVIYMYMVIEIWNNNDSDNGLLPDGTKQLPEPMLTWCERGLVAFVS